MSGTAASALHRRIAAEVAARIMSGEWKPGRRIPFEHELMAEYGCSRMTVSKALGELARSGLIDRRKRSGSFVARPRAQSAVLEIADIRAEVEALGLDYEWNLLKRQIRAATMEERGMLGISGPDRVLTIDGLHRAGGEPFCLESRTIRLAAAPEAEHADFDRSAPGSWLLERVPWSTAEHRIHAAGADALAADVLKLEAGAPCLVVERRTWTTANPPDATRRAQEDGPGQVVTVVRFTYPAAGHALVARFTPTQR